MSSVRRRLFVVACAAALILTTTAAQEETAPIVDPTPDQWTLAFATFDTSSLEAENRLAGDLIARDLVAAMGTLKDRILTEAERNAYASYLKGLAVDRAASAIASRRSSRDALLYAGYSPSKYRVEVRKTLDSLAEAQTAFDKVMAAQATIPTVKSVVKAKDNADGALLAAPKPGEERTLCLSRNADALLLGSVSAYYGRLYVQVRLYSPYLQGNLYTDSTVFSTENRDAALTELGRRLAAAILGRPPARVAVTVQPPEADVTVDGAQVGVGEVAPREVAPGTLEVEASARGYRPFKEEIPASSGESVKLRIVLPPIPTTPISVRALGSDGLEQGTRLYIGGLYVGTTPITLNAPLDSSLYLDAEVPSMGAGAVVIGPPYSGSEVTMTLLPLRDPAAKPVETARRGFYGAFARFSVSLPLAFILSGIATSYRNSAIAYNSTDLGDLSLKVGYAAAGLWSLTGVFAVESIYRFIRYLRNSNERAVKREG